jgi:hypothetical protein
MHSNFVKKAGALLAATAVLAMCPISAEASTLKTEDGVKYIQYDNGDTQVYTGWAKSTSTGKRYYYKNGVMKKSCWLNVKGKHKYFLRKDGSLAVGKVTISGVEYEFDEKGALVTDDMGISITIPEATSTGVTYEVVFERPADDCTNSFVTADGKYKSAYCGNECTIEKYTSKGWQEVPFIAEMDWTDEAFELCGSPSYLWSLKWDMYYGSLDSGKYRLAKKIYYNDDDGTYTNKTYYGYFSL